ncbi:MAG TPA: glycosyl hydrolase 53 family protein [Chitinophagaceae bacterium]|nr:glycosyl hydrolase 53 family protein [Chitinophagaceae bacterium]
MKNKQVLTVLISIFLFAFTCKKKSGIETKPGKKVYSWNEFCMGVDLSYVNQVEDYGGVYRDSGKIKDPFRIMRDHGANTVRVRLWHTPQWIAGLNNGKMYYDLAGTEKTIRRAKENGMAVNLDIHYSDRWADPAHQETPAAWVNLPIAVLKDSVYNYTLHVLNYLKSKDLVPEMVQVGNETNAGMLWPLGKVENNNWQNFAALLNSGISAVRDFSAGSSVKPKIILHVAQFQDADHWTGSLINIGVTNFDILGLSHYPKWSTVSTMDEVENRIKALKAKYNKQVMIVETAYPWTGNNADAYTNIISATDTAAGYEASPQGQFRYMKDLTQAIIRGGGTGIMYWEPAWITSKLNDGWGIGSSWENNAFFDFDGNTLPSIDHMCYPYIL